MSNKILLLSGCSHIKMRKIRTKTLNIKILEKYLDYEYLPVVTEIKLCHVWRLCKQGWLQLGTLKIIPRQVQVL